MSNNEQQTFPLSPFTELIAKYPLRWGIPALVISLAGVVFAFMYTPKWEASLPMIVRNEATTKTKNQQAGEFDRLEQMQTVQETILELSRSRRVVTAALAEVGPRRGKARQGWPTIKDVADLRKLVAMTPPKGGVFGMTEVFYLKVRDKDRQRAIKLASAIARNVQNEYQVLRNRKAQSMMDELARGVTMAQDELNAATEGLSKVETKVAGDLAELRILQQSPSGNSDLRVRQNALEGELRAGRQAAMTTEELLRLLTDAQTNPGGLLATPNRLLESQPSLRRLKDGLVDAQLVTARLQGQLTDKHPEVLAANIAEEEIRLHLSNELDAAVRGLRVDRKLNRARVNQLEKELAELKQRLDRLASVRAEYHNRLKEIDQLTTVLQSAQQNRSEARATHAASHVANLLTVIDQPDTGIKPVTPGRFVIILSGILGGLVVGLGIAFVTAPVEAATAPAIEVVPIPAPQPKSLAAATNVKLALAKLNGDSHRNR